MKPRLQSGKTFYKRKFFSQESVENFSNKYLVCLCGNVKFPMWMQACRRVHYSGYVLYVGILMASFVKGLNGSTRNWIVKLVLQPFCFYSNCSHKLTKYKSSPIICNASIHRATLKCLKSLGHTRFHLPDSLRIE